jgi:hypothetical protein
LAAPEHKPNHPSFLHWSYGEEPYSSPVQAQSADFRFWFDPVVERKPYSFRDEVFAAVEQLDTRREGKTIALCFGGGVKSELIARALRERSIPFELYFLDFWQLNRSAYIEQAEPLAKKLGKELRVVRVERAAFYTHAKKVFLETGCESPTYLAFTYLFENIPSDQFIVTGEGDLDRTGDRFAYIGREHAPSRLDGIYLPFSHSSVFYYVWAQSRKRAGEFYFYGSTPALIASMLTSPILQLEYPFCRVAGIIHDAFPEVAKQPKKLIWDSAEALSENFEIRAALRRVAIVSEQMIFWKKLIGTCVQVDRIFLDREKSRRFEQVSQVT